LFSVLNVIVAGDIRSRIALSRTGGRAREKRETDDCCNSWKHTKGAHGFLLGASQCIVPGSRRKRRVDGHLAISAVLLLPRMAAGHVTRRKHGFVPSMPGPQISAAKSKHSSDRRQSLGR